MKNTLLVIGTLLAMSVTTSEAQIGRQMSLQNSPAYEAAAQSLRNAPPRQYNFSRAVLSDVMRLMAEDAGIGFFGLPEGVEGGDQLVTFTLNASPFTALETLAKANGIALIYENGIWYLRPANDQELIGRIYEINYNAQEIVTKNSQGGSTDSGSSSGGLGASSAGLNLQGAPDFFVTEPSRILEDIQNILDIPTTGSVAQIAPTASVDNVGQFSLGTLQGTPELVVRPSGGRRSGDDSSGPGGAKVIWNSDSNTLYVVASRQQHQWIEAYLESADRPQPMIAVEVKFLETSRDPSTDLGIDWDGVLGQNGLEANLSDASGGIDLANIGAYSLPTAVLSYSDLNLKLRAIFNDRKTRSVSYPRMVTLDNREVSFRSVINQPVLGSSASTSLGAGATQTSSVEYLPIGTVINILPKRMAGDKILLNVSVTVSDIVGTEFINGNPFPIATSRVYTAPLTVRSGYTVAISGLDAARTTESERGVPILGRLPVVGLAFKNQTQDRSRQHLMMLITPVALDSGTEGLTKKPITREPWKAAPVATAHPKAPISEDYYRTNADLRAEPVAEVPAFDNTPESRKANLTFGMKEAEAPAPAEVVISDRATSGAAPEVLKAEPVQQFQPVTSSVAMESASPAPETASLPAAEPSPLNTPMIETDILSDGKLQEEEKPTVEAPKPEPDNSKVSEIVEGAGSLKSDLDKIPAGDDRLSPDDAQTVVNVYNETQKLLEQVEAARGDSSQPLEGQLGDAWWDLINLKTKAVKLSRRSPESLAINLDGEESGE
ncbi:MAG: hypothetical protein CMO55_07430 [Verrucomicrobiales bacterium]|nr:hypothetical protein [Verrucomicrobiales bacterium]